MNSKAIIISGCVSATALAGAFLAGQSTTPSQPVAIPPSVVESSSGNEEVTEQADVADTSSRTADADAEVVRQDLTRSPVVITAPALAFEFDRNEVAANDKYADRVIRIMGSIYSIDDADQYGNPPVAWLQTEVYAGKVGVVIPRDEAATLRKYQSAAFDCYGAEKRFRVLAKDCTIAQ